MSALPAYEPSPTAGSPLPGEDAGPSTYAGSCYGGGGVRLPCSYREKVDLDNLLIKSLSANKTPITWESFEVGRRTVHTFDPIALYRTAVSQLDVLLPLLQPDGLAPTTSMRTITLRLPQLPRVDKEYARKLIMSSYRKEGREEIGNALKDWFARVGVRGGMLWSVADCIVERICMDGFVVYEEYWNLAYHTAQFVVRC